MAPCTEFALDFCAGIGPLQLGVVLVCYLNGLAKRNFLNSSTFRIGRIDQTKS